VGDEAIIEAKTEALIGQREYFTLISAAEPVEHRKQ
jgi:hypothetical protein